jgi:glycogen synthase
MLRPASLRAAGARHRTDLEDTMKILIYSHYFLPSVGGVERVVESLARGFSERGHRVTVATATLADPAGDAGLPYRILRRPGVFSLMRLIREHDVTHLAGPALLPMFLAWLLRRPFVIEHHSYQAVCPNGLLLQQPAGTVCPGHFQAGRHRECLRCNSGRGQWKSFRMWLLGFPRLLLCRRTSSNIAISRHVSNRLSLPRSRLIYHGVPDASVTSNLGAKQPGPDAPLCFAYIGRFVPEKGLSALIEAAAILQQEGVSFRLKLIGDGPERPRLEASVKARGLQERIVFTGMLAPEDLARASADVSVAVMSSLCEEMCPLAPIEQMMRGKALVVSSIGGLAEVVGEAGLQFQPADSAGLASCMRRLAAEPELVRRLGEAARDRALTLFRYGEMIEAHLKLYREVSVRGPEPGARRRLG